MFFNLLLYQLMGLLLLVCATSSVFSPADEVQAFLLVLLLCATGVEGCGGVAVPFLPLVVVVCGPLSFYFFNDSSGTFCFCFLN